MIPNRAPNEQPQSLTGFAVIGWRKGLDTYEIAAQATAAFGFPINEASVARVLARLRDQKAGAV